MSHRESVPMPAKATRGKGPATKRARARIRARAVIEARVQALNDAARKS